jgi:phenylalanyl-tRNA synthetase beta chain
VHIRTAKKGEKIKTLDDVDRVLPEGAIVLSDSKGVFDLLGIMGGLRSSTKATTKNLYLHAAIVDPVSIRKAIIATGHRTEASTVYEKGIPRVFAEIGFLRALELILEHVPGARITSTMENAGKDDVRKVVTMPVDMVQKLTGANITAAQTKKILSDLGCTVTATKKDMKVMPPAWRNDLLLPQDIVEEVARIYGYAKIPAAMPEASTALPPRSFALHQIRDALKSQKFTELIHLAFTSPQIIRASGSDPAKAVSIENPIGEELSLMRMSLLPAMLETVSRQLTQTDLPHIAVYEHGHVFAEKKESHEIALVIAARSDTGITNDPFLMTKRALADATAATGYALTFGAAKNIPSSAHAGRIADVIAGGAIIGQIYEVHPAIRKSFDLPARAAAAVINLGSLFKVSSTVMLAKAIPLFPAIIFDETVPLSSAHAQQSLVTRLQRIDPLLESVTVRDYYAQGTSRNVTFRFTYRSAGRTLTQQEVDAVHKKVLAELAASGR